MLAIDLEGAEGVIVRLNDFPRRIRAELRPRIRQAGEIVAAQARSNASWSSRIPAATSVRTSFALGVTEGVAVRVNAAAAPHARPLEFGNRGGVNWHPVFGHGPNVPQPTRPFLFPAARAKRPEAVRLVSDALRAAVNS